VDYVSALPDLAPHFIIEMVAETIEAKREVYAEVERCYPTGHYWLATGTSGLDLIVLAALLQRPERFLAIHYYMPAAVVATVEVAAGPQTPAHAVDAVAAALRRTGKDPLLLYRPVVGFIINRLQHAILNEAYRLIESGITTAADIDRAARAMLGPRMCINGLIEQKDISGLRIHADAQRSIVPSLNHEATACALLQEMVARGETGLDAGRGFYDWTGQSPKRVRQATADRLAALLRFLAEDRAKAAAALPSERDDAARP
ncbi:MAG: 3-hydroxyacyl-CoA dehydrogenase NAD-binding domain-containing protein, partial [Pseudomonadota bacterium]|nr:3-hydroxyacyl-CoA dehydrogenase NAD-binding domain-containing protein [Pseudomonadota bacterium]